MKTHRLSVLRRRARGGIMTRMLFALAVGGGGVWFGAENATDVKRTIDAVQQWCCQAQQQLTQQVERLRNGGSTTAAAPARWSPPTPPAPQRHVHVAPPSPRPATQPGRTVSTTSSTTPGRTPAAPRTAADDWRDLARESRDMAGRFRDGMGRKQKLGDRLIEGMIEATTPEADEDIRRVQRDAVKFLVSPSREGSQRHLDNMMENVRRQFGQ